MPQQQFEKKPRKNTTITPGFISPWEQPQQAGWKPSFRVGFTLGGEGYYLRCYQQELMQYFENGKQTAIEYHTTDAGNHVIDGASPVGWEPSAVATAPAGGDFGGGKSSPNGKDFRTRPEIIRSEALHIASRLLEGSGLSPESIVAAAQVFVDFITEPTLDTLEKKVEAVGEILGGVPERDINQEEEDDIDAALNAGSSLPDDNNDEGFSL